jgi:FkbM family methyltransferase
MQLLWLLSYVLRHPLNAGGRSQAIGRLLRWQISSRLLAGPIALDFVEDTRLFASRGMTGATGNWYCGLHELEEMAFVLHFLRPTDLFLDVGANIGSYTVMVAGGIGARVISIEPIPAAFSNLQRNLLLNTLNDRVEPHCIALSSGRSDLRFTSDQDTVNHVMVEGEVGRSIHVPSVSMDELLDGRVPALIKIDVEGHEHAVLKGAGRTLSEPRVAAVVMEVNGSGTRYGVSDNDLLATMREYRFLPYAYDPFQRKLRDWDSAARNAIFVRDRDEVDSRVPNAKRYRLVNGTI